MPYVNVFAVIGSIAADTENYGVLPENIPDSIQSQLGKKLTAYAPSDRTPLQETVS